jgi:lipopolysaccharide heptosyltransferase II
MPPSWRAARNLLCVRLDGVGDVLMTTPAIRALKESIADSRVTLLTSKAGAQVARRVPEIDDVLTFDAPWMKADRGSPHGDRSLVARLQAARFDAAVVFTVYSQSPLPAAYVCYLAGIPLSLAHCRENPYQLLSDWVAEPEPARCVRHEVRRQLDLVATIGAAPRHERLSFDVPVSAKRRARATLAASGVRSGRPLVLAHPGATAPSRRYPPASFARALDLLAAEGCEVALTGTAAERPLVDSIRAAMTEPAATLAGELELAELGAAIAAADVLVTNNTAPAHIAAALGTPVVDLYALTNPQHTPWSVPSRVLYHDVPCRYCYKSVCPAGHHECLTLVQPEAVHAAALELLHARRDTAHARPPVALDTAPLPALRPI